MVFRFFLVLLFLAVSSPLFSKIPIQALDFYYQKQYRQTVLLLSSETDFDSRVFLAKTYVAMEEKEKARAVLQSLPSKPENLPSEFIEYVRYLNVITAPDLTVYADQTSMFKSWPSTFEQRAIFLIATACLKQKQLSKAEALFLELKAQGYSLKEVYSSLVSIAVLNRDSSKALNYYQQLLMQFPDADLNRSLYASIAFLNSDLSPSFSFASVFQDPKLLLAFSQNAFEARFFKTVSSSVTTLLSPSSSYVSDASFLLASSFFELKQYTKAETLLSGFNDSDEKGVLLKAKLFQKLENYDKALSSYELFIQKFPNSTMLPEVYFNIYWILKAQNKQDEFLSYFQAMQRRFSASSFFDKLCFELGFDAYKSKRYSQALIYFQRRSGNVDDEFNAKCLYFSAKSADFFDPSLALKLRKKCVSLYPSTYYSTRLFLQYPIELEWSFYAAKIRSKPLPVISSSISLFEYGLSEWEVYRLKDQLAQKKRDSNSQMAYTLAVLYQKMQQPYQAIRVLRRFNLFFSFKDSVVSRELMELFYPRPYFNFVLESSSIYKLDPYFVLSVMRQESEYHSDAISKSGALGLMQVMPATAKGIADSLRISNFSDSMMFSPSVNIRFGTYYLGMLQTRFLGKKEYMLSGYNAGPNITKKWSENPAILGNSMDEFIENIPYSEPHYYIMRILRNYFIYQLLYQKEQDFGPVLED